MATVSVFPARRVQVRYRSTDGSLVDTTLDRVVVDEVVNGLPVREFRWYKGRRHYSGWYYSSTMHRLELARIMLADFDPQVVGIAAQPFQLIGRDGSRVRRHVPDVVLVDAAGGVTVVDVKAPSKRGDARVQTLMEWTGRAAALRGWSFEEWYGASAQLLDNVTFLAGYRRRSVIDAALIPRVMAAVAEAGSSIVEVEHAISGRYPALIRPVILHLLWTGALVADMSQPLSGTNIVRPHAGVVE